MKESPLKVLLFTPSKGLATESARKPVYPIQPLAVLYVASALREWADFPCSIKVIDAYTFGYGPGEIRRSIEEFRPHVIGVSATTVRIFDAQRICSLAKSIDPATITVVGGPHASSAAEETAANKETDIAVIGEGERTFLEICRAVHRREDWRGIDGIAYSDGSGVTINRARPYMEDLDTIPFPDLGFLPPIRNYNPLPVWGKSGNFSTVITSRGCPYGCSYCSVHRIQGGKYRYHSAKYVMSLLKELYEERNVRNVIFKEGTLTRKRERVVDLCRHMIEDALHISWTCNARADELDPELLELMKKAGCTCIQIGVEQGNPELIQKYKKVKKEEVMRVVREIREAGIDAHGCFMLGMPEENLSTIAETIAFAQSLPLNTAFFNIFTPRPGTRIFEECEREGLIQRPKWDRFDDRRSVWNHPALSERQLAAAKRRAFRRFYLRPSIIADRIRHIKNWKDFANHVRGAKNLFVN